MRIITKEVFDIGMNNSRLKTSYLSEESDSTF